MKHLLLHLSLILIGSVFGQVDFNNYKTIQCEGDIPKDFSMSTYDKVQDQLMTATTELSKKQEKDFYEGINYGVDELLHSGNIVYGDPVSLYVKSVAQKLLKKDGLLFDRLRFYTVKANEANAFSTDQGIIFVTTGLIAQLTSEAQLAFILSHEISHYEEKHVVDTYSWRANKSHREQIQQLSNYSKEKELDADRLGMKRFHDAGYSAQEISGTFDVLMYSYLPFDEVPFNKSYYNTPTCYVPNTLFSEKNFSITAQEDYNDEKSSHPNIKKRKEAVEKEIGNYSDWGTGINLLGDDKFNLIRTICRFETIRTDILNNEYVDALYSIYILETIYPTSNFLIKMKAHCYYNMMLYRDNNKGSEFVKKNSEMEGESAQLHYFYKNLKKEALLALCLRQIYDIKSKRTNDPEIHSLYNKSLECLAKSDIFKLDKFSQNTFFEAIISLENDTNRVWNEIEDGNRSKYDKIKAKKNQENSVTFDSTKFHLFILSDILKDSSFTSSFRSYQAIEENRIKKEEEFKKLSNSEKKKVLKAEWANASHFGLTEVIVTDPKVLSYRRGNVNNTKSEKLESVFASVIQEAALDAGISSYMINRASLQKYGTHAFNEKNTLISFLNQLSNDGDVSVFPVDYDLLKEIRKNYGTNHVMFSLVEHRYQVNINFRTLLLSYLFYPVSFYYVPNALLTANATELYVLMLNLDSGSFEHGIDYTFTDAPKKLELGAHMYDLFNNFKKNP